MREKMILGFTTNNEVVFANVENRRGHFSVSFDASYPQILTEDDQLNYYENLMDEMDGDWKFDLLERFDCKPSELAENMVRYESIEDTFDTSLYSEQFELGNDTVYFMASGCGQHDTRGHMDIILDETMYNRIHELWDQYHLKSIEQDVIDELEKQIKRYNLKFDDIEVVSKWLSKENIINS